MLQSLGLPICILHIWQHGDDVICMDPQDLVHDSNWELPYSLGVQILEGIQIFCHNVTFFCFFYLVLFHHVIFFLWMIMMEFRNLEL
jgi:hypothetical protein